MAINLAVVDNYARALLAVAARAQRLEAVFASARELVAFLELPQSGPLSARVRVFIESPQTPDDEKHHLIHAMFDGRLEPLLIDMMCLMIDKRRSSSVLPVMRRFCELADEREGVEAGSVTTPLPLDETERGAVRERLERFTGCKLRLRYRVDPELLGGLRFKYRDLLIDDTLRDALGDLRARLDGLRLRLAPPPMGGEAKA